MSERILPLSNTQAKALAGRTWCVQGRTLFFKSLDPVSPGNLPWKSGAEGKAYPLLDYAGATAAYIKFFSTDSPKRFTRAEWLIAQKVPKWLPQLSAAPAQWLDSRVVGRPDGVDFDLTGCVAALAPGDTWLELKYPLSENPVLLTLEQRWRLVSELIATLAVLEPAGLIHGDLSPNNLVIDLEVCETGCGCGFAMFEFSEGQFSKREHRPTKLCERPNKSGFFP